MRIFYAAWDSPHPDLASRIWYKNLYLPLVDLGHEVVRFAYDMAPSMRHLDPSSAASCAFIEENRPKLERALVEQIEREHRKKPIQLFFSYFYDACCRPDVIRHIRGLGIQTVNFYCNASYQLHLVADLAPAYDHCFVPERFRLDDYRRLGARPIHVREAANPSFYAPRRCRERADVTFVGQAYGERPSLVQRLSKAGVRVRVYGPGWRERDLGGTRTRRVLERAGLGVTHAPLDDDELVRAYSWSRVSLGFAACGENLVPRITQVRLRDFEAPMSGAFYLSEHVDELVECFEPDKEIVTYRSADELVEQVQRWLPRKTERLAVRKAARRRALAEHTWQQRFAVAFREIGLPSYGSASTAR